MLLPGLVFLFFCLSSAEVVMSLPTIEMLERRALCAAGSLDPRFGAGGTVGLDFVAEDLAVASDGKIVVVGHDSDLNRSSFQVRRFNPDGTPDLMFGTGGKTTTTIGGASAAFTVSIQDGRVIVAGSSDHNLLKGIDTPGFSRVAVVRYDNQGNLDLGFSDDGIIVEQFGGGDQTAAAFDSIVEPSGRVLVVGTGRDTVNDSNSFTILLAYNDDGSQDLPFGYFNEGSTVIVIPTGGELIARTIARQDDGKILVVGSFRAPEGNWDFAVQRYNPDGRLDNGDGSIGNNGLPNDVNSSDSFGAGGLATIDFDGRDDIGKAMTILPNDIVVAGDTRTVAGPRDFAVAALKPNGSTDSRLFDGVTGRSTRDVGGDDAVNSVVMDRYKDVLVGGISFVGDGAAAAYVGFDPAQVFITSGEPDFRFPTALLDLSELLPAGLRQQDLDDGGALQQKFALFLEKVANLLQVSPGGKFVSLVTFEGDATLAQLLSDRTRPHKSLNVQAGAMPGILELRRDRKFLTLSVKFSDDVGVYARSLDNKDFILVDKNKVQLPVVFIDSNRQPGVNPATRNASFISARYQIRGPGGSWDRSDNGDYALILQQGQVRDTSNNAVLVGRFFTIRVFIPKSVSVTPSHLSHSDVAQISTLWAMSAPPPPAPLTRSRRESDALTS
jgi:uncharacterized delta-60 repeat protein